MKIVVHVQTHTVDEAVRILCLDIDDNSIFLAEDRSDSGIENPDRGWFILRRATPTSGITADENEQQRSSA